MLKLICEYIIRTLLLTMNKINCIYCNKLLSKGYFKRHLKTKKHLSNFVKYELEERKKLDFEKGRTEIFLLNKTEKYDYDMEYMVDLVKEKWLVKDIRDMVVDMEISELIERRTELRLERDEWSRIWRGELRKSYEGRFKYMEQLDDMCSLCLRESFVVGDLIVELKIKYKGYKRSKVEVSFLNTLKETYKCMEEYENEKNSGYKNEMGVVLKEYL